MQQDVEKTSEIVSERGYVKDICILAASLLSIIKLKRGVLERIAESIR